MVNFKEICQFFKVPGGGGGSNFFQGGGGGGSDCLFPIENH